MKILVCGGRNFSDAAFVNYVLDDKHADGGPVDMIIEGGARGADALGKAWAEKNGVHYAHVPALWSFYKNGAGPLRNEAMLLLRPDLVIAFAGGSGTADMVRRAHAAGVRVLMPVRLDTSVNSG